MADVLVSLVVDVAQRLTEKRLRLAVAESCTGGWLAKQCTDLAGSSEWFECGFVTYSNQSKQSMLGVSGETLETWGAVSEPVVLEMAKGALTNSAAQLAISISGIAGPGGGSSEKPVGTVCFGWAFEGKVTGAITRHLDGDRKSIRKQSVILSLEKVLEIIS